MCPIILGTGTCTQSSFNNVHKVRIELTNSDFLHLREVEVFDMNDVNIAEGKPATQSSTQNINVANEAGRAVDGDFITRSWTTWSSSE